MSGDIEDFLRRAAQRRQARQQKQAGSAPPPRRPRPEYTDARRERLPQQQSELDEPVVAEVVNEPLAKRLADMKQAQADAHAARDRATETVRQQRRQAERGESSSPQHEPAAGETAPPAKTETAARLDAGQADPASDSPNETVRQLLQALRSPQGLRNAVLLHEILDRPTHRW